MTGRTFVGANNKSVIPRRTYIGINNIARKVSAAYVGDENNKAKKIWPVSVLPSEFQQLEWITFKSNDAAFVTYVKFFDQPRIVMTFEIPDPGFYGQYGYLFGYYSGGERFDKNNNSILYHIMESRLYSSRGFRIEHGFNTEDFQKDTNLNEKYLTDALYMIDFNNLNAGMSQYYLYCEKGYYSIPKNNLIGSHAKYDYSILRDEYRQREDAADYINLLNNREAYHYEFEYSINPIKFYHCTMYDNSGDTSGDIIHDYYPCYRKSDNKIGLYDYTDRIFLPNATDLSSDSYILGPEV